MGWKAIKDHYRIVHQVQVTKKGICIGSPYIHDIMIVSMDGELVKDDGSSVNADLNRYRAEMRADPAKLRELAATVDTFAKSVTVYTYDDARIIEKSCEEPGWPNVTHDGEMMYENTFSTDRAKVVEWAKKDCLSLISHLREAVDRQRDELAQWEGRLSKALADAKTLGVTPPLAAPPPPPAGE